MTCPTCKRATVQLFLSVACDHCDFGIPKEKLHRGYVVHGRNEVTVEEHVFRARVDAEQYRVASGRTCCQVRVVYSLTPFTWQLSRGLLQNITLASKMHEIFPDHRHEALPNRAFLMEES